MGLELEKLGFSDSRTFIILKGEEKLLEDL